MIVQLFQDSVLTMLNAKRLTLMVQTSIHSTVESIYFKIIISGEGHASS